jgi:murein L,D-transpeptidase YcbB/YkuD
MISIEFLRGERLAQRALPKRPAIKRTLLAILALGLCAAAAPAEQSAPAWSPADIAVLERWVHTAPLDALPEPSTAALDGAMTGGDQMAIDRAATALALKLARMQLLGRAGASERKGWNIVDTDKSIDLDALLRQSLAAGTLDAFYASLLPRNPDYAALRAAYATETDPAVRATIARNMERWRWMPHSLGPDYVLVNAPAFEAQLWRGGEEVGTWKVIVGKKSTPTPVFNATITGVILNPWWEVPASIMREMRGRFPASKGYVWSGGRVRQRPGPTNALGQMKLVMPNRFTVYMHDTPSKQLFERDVRAFSHGCIRTQDAVGYATTLLQGVKTPEEVDAILVSRQTTKIGLAKTLPVYVAYFTAVGDGNGGVKILPDIYRRDALISG